MPFQKTRGTAAPRGQCHTGSDRRRARSRDHGTRSPARLAARHPAPATAETAKGTRLIVGPDIKLKGVEITVCDPLVVWGTVEAAIDSWVIQIAERGVFKGTDSIDFAEIRGRLERRTHRTLIIDRACQRQAVRKNPLWPHQNRGRRRTVRRCRPRRQHQAPAPRGHAAQTGLG